MRLLLLAGLLGLAVPDVAAAEIELVRGNGLTLAPELAGPQVVYGQRLDARRTRIFAVSPGRRPRTLRTVQGLGAFAASPSRLAFAHAEYERADEDHALVRGRVRGGALGGPDIEVIDRARPRAIIPRGVDLDGDRLAASGAGCADDRVLVQDLVPGGTVAVVQAPALASGRVSVAGPYVAFMSLGRDDSRLLVHDVATGARVYESPLRDVVALDMEPDGTVVTLQAVNPPVPRGPCYLGTVRRHTAADPAGRAVTGGACTEGVRVADGRVAFVRPVGAQRQLVVEDLASAALRPVVNLRAR